MCCHMCTSVPPGRRVHLFFLRGSKMYTSGSIANSQSMLTEINENGVITKLRFEWKVILSNISLLILS